MSRSVQTPTGSIDRIINISKNPNKPEHTHFIDTWNGGKHKYYINGKKVSLREYKGLLKGAGH